jgi:putative transposase
MMVGLNDRHKIVAEVLEAVKAGASKKNACETIDLNIRTFQRWLYCSHVQSDQRHITDRPEPKNKFSSSEYQVIVDYCNSAEYASSPPCQMVPSLAEKDVYIGSESSFYRVLKAAKRKSSWSTGDGVSRRKHLKNQPAIPQQVRIKCGVGILATCQPPSLGSIIICIFLWIFTAERL